jgi:hypothetical protein
MTQGSDASPSSSRSLPTSGMMPAVRIVAIGCHTSSSISKHATLISEDRVVAVQGTSPDFLFGLHFALETPRDGTKQTSAVG